MMTMTGTSEELNAELRALLAERRAVFATACYGRGMMDEDVERWKRVREVYNGWGQLDKDIWYICSTRNITECARLMQVCRRTIKKRYKELCQQLQ